MTTERTRRSQGRALLRGFPLTVMSIATFAVIFALLMARVSRDPALDARTAAARAGIVGGSTAALTRTRTSGGAVEAPVAASGSGATVPASAVVARTSGGGAAGAEPDDG